MFIPVTRDEARERGWDGFEVIIVTGDAYVDHPAMGAAVIGHVLIDAGYRVGIISQPSMTDDGDFTRLGEPSLFWGITAGAIDSMVANYTAARKFRQSDDLTPGGVNDRRPDRATIAYANRIRRRYKNTAPVVIGGLEASLRRLAHYDFWSNSVRRSLLLDARADILVYGMAEGTVLELAAALKEGRPWRDIRGICYRADVNDRGFEDLPSFEDVSADPERFAVMFERFYGNADPVSGKGLSQRHGDKVVMQNPPAPLILPAQLDRLHTLPFEREVHPRDRAAGEVRALDTIRFSLTTHRGCFGECNFCAITVHQGRAVVSRGRAAIVAEARALTRHPRFRGSITDVGGPTANMYGMTCPRWRATGACRDRRCIHPSRCPGLRASHRDQITLLRALRRIPGVTSVRVASGVRYDLILDDQPDGERYLAELVEHHVGGQMKVAPEHCNETVLRLMGKQGIEALMRFKELFERHRRRSGREQYLTYYFMAAHPGCREGDMAALHDFVRRELKAQPEQVQVFTPLPSIRSTVMYCTGLDSETGRRIFVERTSRGREAQKRIITEGSARRTERKGTIRYIENDKKGKKNRKK